MPIYKPSELHLFLNSIGIHPKKGLSQNFLIDGNIIRKIVKISDVQPHDVVLEIGPGPGSLTEELLNAGASVIAVEKDPILASALERLKSPDRHLEIFCQDIMEFPIGPSLKRLLKGGQKGKVIANLPYHLTSPILAQLVPLHEIFSELVVMVQDEVAQRMVAKPGNKDYSSFTLFLNYHCQVKYGFTVSKNCFYPAPKVNSAIVILELQKPPTVSDPEAFFKMTRRAFEQRRKMLRSSLKDLYPPEKIMGALTQLKLNPQARPEDLSLTEFISFFERVVF